MIESVLVKAVVPVAQINWDDPPFSAAPKWLQTLVQIGYLVPGESPRTKTPLWLAHPRGGGTKAVLIGDELVYNHETKILQFVANSDFLDVPELPKEPLDVPN